MHVLDRQAAAKGLLHQHDPAVGRACVACCSSARACSLDGSSSLRQWNDEPARSVERSAFCSASVKLRPIDIASPTLFIVVVSVGSAAGNFSNTNRGTLTTT